MMARYRDVPEDIKIRSEMIEPAFGSIIGRLFAQAQYMEKTYGQKSTEHADALENLWQAMEHMQSLSGLCIDTHHATQVLMNHSRQIGRYIKSKLGFHPLDVDLYNNPFRHLVVEDGE